jgi:hypothetical protein
LLPLLRALQTGGTLEQVIAATQPLPAPSSIRDAFARWRERRWIALAPAGHTAPVTPAFSSVPASASP